jgi:hypothetical protein
MLEGSAVTPSCWQPTLRATGTPSTSCSAVINDSFTGLRASPAAPSKTPKTRCKTPCSQPTAPPVPFGTTPRWPVKAHPTTPLEDVYPVADRTSHIDTAIVVQRALMRLPVEQRAAVVAVDMQGYSIADTAHLLGVAEGTVKSRCARARVRLAGMLGHLDAGAPATTDRPGGQR